MKNIKSFTGANSRKYRGAIFSGDIRKALKSNWRVIFLTLTLISGVLVGALTVRGYGDSMPSYVVNLFKNNFSSRLGQPFFSTFFGSLKSDIPFLVLSFLFGLCALGAPAAPLLIGFRGLGFGLVTGYLFSAYGLKGFAYSCLMIIPSGFISSFALLLATCQTLSFSAGLFRLIAPKEMRSEPVNSEFKLYFFRFLFITLLFVLSALIDAMMSTAFIGFFESSMTAA